MANKKRPQAVGKVGKTRQRPGRPPLPDGTVQTRVSLPPQCAEWFAEGADKAGMSVPQFIGLCARHGFKAGLNAALGLPQMEEAA